MDVLPFSNLTFVFTGDMATPRDDAKSMVIKLGGRVTTAPSSKTTYLVIGTEPGPKKMEKAKTLKIKIIDENEFLALVNQNEISFDDEFSVNIAPETNDIKSNTNIASELKNTELSNNITPESGNKKFKNIAPESGNIELSNNITREINDKKSNKIAPESGNIEVSNNIKFNSNSLLQNNNSMSHNINPNLVTHEMWTEKYRPSKLTDIIGNSNIVLQLQDFLHGSTKFKACLLSGSPGMGKTTCAHLVAAEMGFEVIEFNASDTRNKSEVVKKMGSLNFASLKRDGSLNRRVIIMDEIDGMASDRGGLAELNVCIKKTPSYIICICNDRNNPRLRTIASNCLDLRFRKLIPTQILPRLRHILKQENKQVRDNILNEIVKNSNGDLRFCINTLQNLCLRETLSHKQIDSLMHKSINRNIFETATEIMAKRKVSDKMNLYFEDYSILPLFVQENYLKMNFRNIYEIGKAAESISYSDVIDSHIHGLNQEWWLLPLHAFYSSILPVSGKILSKRIDFPSFLGQRSKQLKQTRVLSEIHSHSFRHIKCNRIEFRLYCLDLIFNRIVSKLQGGCIEEGLGVLCEYDLLKVDYENMAGLVRGGDDQVKNVGTKNKASFTKKYKGLKRVVPYHIEEGKKSVEEEVSNEE